MTYCVVAGSINNVIVDDKKQIFENFKKRYNTNLDDGWFVPWMKALIKAAGVTSTEIDAVRYLLTQVRSISYFFGYLCPSNLAEKKEFWGKLDKFIFDNSSPGPFKAIAFITSYYPTFATDIEKVLSDEGTKENIIALLQGKFLSITKSESDLQKKSREIIDKIFLAYAHDSYTPDTGDTPETRINKLSHKLSALANTARDKGDQQTIARSYAYAAGLVGNPEIHDDIRWHFGKLITMSLEYKQHTKPIWCSYSGI